uniref:Candidate secreted effector n=1 Tax=Meloidogyne incognita TaxID=6306 RepID=A0A914MCZ5_MELIC
MECLFPSKAKKLAIIIVCMKMLLFCCWLFHEIASGFDEGQCLAIKKEENKILEKLENNLLKSTDNLQTTPINSDNSKMEQPKQGVKRRRKVILRRRLLRKGDGRSSIVSKSIEDSNTTKNNSKQKRGNSPSSTMAVRRVIWKIVPLKKLPDNEENEEEEDENLINLNNKKNNSNKNKNCQSCVKKN